MKKIVLYKSPTCGPCKMFAPICKKCAEANCLEYEEIDVTTDEGLKKAEANNVTHSGVAMLVIDNVVKYTWDRPCPENKFMEALTPFI